MVSISASHAEDPGSIPGRGALSLSVSDAANRFESSGSFPCSDVGGLEFLMHSTSCSAGAFDCILILFAKKMYSMLPGPFVVCHANS